MPELIWDETDLVACLEVIATIEEYGNYYYEVKQDILLLAVSIWPYESVVAVSLSQTGDAKPLISFTLVVRDSIRYVKDKRGEYLEFKNCVIVSHRFYYTEVKDIFDQTKFTDDLVMEMSIKPHICVKFK